MGDILKAIYDDIEEYKWLCQHFDEPVVRKSDAYGNMLPDCYGPHCAQLQERYRKEQR